MSKRSPKVVSSSVPAKDTCSLSVESATIDETSNENLNPDVPGNGVLVKIPVVLSEFKVQIDIEASINLDEPALDIKRIKKNVFITQCKLIPFTRKVFLGGFVRKNIEYSTVVSSGDCSINGNIKHTTVDVPFTTVTEVDFLRYPQFNQNFATDSNTLDCCIAGKDMSEDNLINLEYYNEPIFCEILSSFIQEIDIHEDEMPIQSGLKHEKLFQKIREKMVIYVTMKILQKQQVVLEVEHCPTVPHPCTCKNTPLAKDAYYKNNLVYDKYTNEDPDDEED